MFLILRFCSSRLCSRSSLHLLLRRCIRGCSCDSFLLYSLQAIGRLFRNSCSTPVFRDSFFFSLVLAKHVPCSFQLKGIPTSYMLINWSLATFRVLLPLTVWMCAYTIVHPHPRSPVIARQSLVERNIVDFWFDVPARFITSTKHWSQPTAFNVPYHRFAIQQSKYFQSTSTHINPISHFFSKVCTHCPYPTMLSSHMHDLLLNFDPQIITAANHKYRPALLMPPTSKNMCIVARLYS